MKNIILSLLIACSLLIPCRETTAYNVSSDWVRVSGNQVVTGTNAEVLFLRGVNFSHDRIVRPDGQWIAGGTCADLNDYPSTTPVTNWYSEQHIQNIANIGFNVIRMDLHYRVFEDDSAQGVYKSSGWTLIDQYIQWAKKYNIYLILDLHVPQGGLQPTGGGGSCLWDAVANSTRLINLWKAIAQRYASEPTIAAYDLLNEPTPTGNSLQDGSDKYQGLAQQIVDAIRPVDKNHMIIVERINWIMNSDGTSPLSNYSTQVLNSFQVSVNDSSNNVIYDFHFYDPTVYTLQNEGNNPGDGNYPDTTVMETAKDGTAMPRGKNYLNHELQLEIKNNGPMFAGEWGPNDSTFNTTKGGYTYIQDTLDILNTGKIHWAYYSMFNLYTVSCCDTGYVCCSGNNPTTPAYPTLINLFKQYFSNKPAPDIKANGLDAQVFLKLNDNLSVTISLVANNGAGQNADWWVAAVAPSGAYYYNTASSWLPGLLPTAQGNLADISSIEVLKTSGLAPGTYTFYFAVDTTVNGSPDSQIYLDSVAVIVK